MAQSATLLNSGSEFDDFLFAPLGDDERGTAVSVLSAFARLDFDPWQEAAEFARLPREMAKTKLTTMITALPGMSPTHAEPSAVAARLIVLLPRRARVAVASRQAWLGAGHATERRSSRIFVSIVIFMALGFASQFLVANCRPAVDGPQGQASDTTHPQAPAPSLGDMASITGSATGDVMSDGKKPRDMIDLHGKDGKTALAQLAQQSQANAATPPVPTATPVRRPLFGK